jgi:hypothetical protein
MSNLVIYSCHLISLDDQIKRDEMDQSLSMQSEIKIDMFTTMLLDHLKTWIVLEDLGTDWKLIIKIYYVQYRGNLR